MTNPRFSRWGVALTSAGVLIATLWAATATADRDARPRAQQDPLTLDVAAWHQHGGVTRVMRHSPGAIWMGRGPRLVALDPNGPVEHRILDESEPLGGTVLDLATGGVEPNAYGGPPTRGWALTAGQRLVALQMAGPDQVDVLAASSLPASPVGLAAVGDHVWVLGRDANLRGYRLDAPAGGAPTLAHAATLDLGVSTWSMVGVVAVEDHVVVAATGDERSGAPMLHVTRVSDPDAPEVVGSLASPWAPGRVMGITVDAGTLFVLSQTGDLMSVDLTDPSQPTILSMVATDHSSPMGLQVGDGQAYVIGGDRTHNILSLTVVDVGTPRLLGPVFNAVTLPHLPDPAGGMLAADDRFWYATENGHLLTMDATRPSHDIHVVGRSFGLAHAGRLAVRGDVGLLGSTESLHVLDTTWRTWPHSVSETLLHHYPQSVAITGPMGTSATGTGGTGTSGTGTSAAATGATGLVVTAGMMDVLDSGLRALDLTEPSHPVASGPLFESHRLHVGSLRLWGRLGTLVASDLEDDRPQEIALVDVTVPMSPTILGWVTRPYGLQDAAIQGDRLVAVGPHPPLDPIVPLELIVANISDPTSPTVVGSVALADNPVDWLHAAVAVDGDHAYVTASSGWVTVSVTVHVVDISEPAAPVEVAEIPLQDPVGPPTVAHGYLLVPTVGGALVFDVADPSMPALLGRLATGADRVVAAVVDDGMLLLPSGSAGIYAVWPKLDRWPEPDFVPPPTRTPLPPTTPTAPRPSETPRPGVSLFLPVAET